MDNARSWLSDPNLLGFTLDEAHQIILRGFRNRLPADDRMPPQLKAVEPSISMFDRFPNPHQAFAPLSNTSYKEHGQHKSPGTFTSSSSPKKFLVFDQSCSKTTFMLTSGVPNNFSMPYSSYKEEPRGNNLYPPRLLMNDSESQNIEDAAEEDEIREDTEELNALLYSDSDDYSDDDDGDEVASTGHSPSTMTDERAVDPTDETEEEVDSVCKRQKLSNGDRLTTSDYNRQKGSFETRERSVLEDDAESSFCHGSKQQQQLRQDLGSVSCGKKRSRKEKLLENVRILQSIIPGSKGKDALVVIDEAIRYLKSIKVKAEALGFESL